MGDSSDRNYLRIAVEEAFCPPQLFDIYREIIADNAVDDPGFMSQWRYFLNSQSERAVFVRGASTCRRKSVLPSPSTSLRMR
jgi:hypothetical protein